MIVKGGFCCGPLLYSKLTVVITGYCTKACYASISVSARLGGGRPVDSDFMYTSSCRLFLFNLHYTVCI